MNQLFGAINLSTPSAGTRSSALDELARYESWLKPKLGNSQCTVRGTASFGLGLVNDGGAVVGVAEREALSLCFLGSLVGPVPEWNEQVSPIDDPNLSAAYLLERYQRLGAKFLDGLYGQYALVLFDAAQNEVILGRDPGGERRLFFAMEGGCLRFSTQVAGFRALVPNLRIDRSWEDFFLAHEFLPGERTHYHGVSSLSAGTLLRFRGDTIERTVIAKGHPWKPWLEGLDLTTEDQVVRALEEAFFRALEEQCPKAERVGVLLGGFDSELIAAGLVRLGKRVETFSFQYEDVGYNQAFAEELAERLGIRHHWVPIMPEVMRRGLLHFELAFNQPVCQPHYLIATAEACRAVRNAGIRHCFTGDGCDGLFLGYPTVHQRAVLIDTLSRVAPVVHALGSSLVRSRFLEEKLGHPYRVARNVLRVLKRPMPARAHVASNILDDFSLRLLRKDAPQQDRNIEEVLIEMAQGLEQVSTVRLAYRGKAVVGLNKNKLEGCSSSTGITLQSPFLHPGMVHLASLLPEELSRPSRATRAETTGKYALMLMAEQRSYLPTEMIYQTKRSPVTAPVDLWYMGSLREVFLQQFRRLPFEYDADYAASLLDHKLAEDVFRQYVGISRYAFNAPALLATYASFTGEGPAQAGSDARHR